jgi:Flp pilus assembly protein TadB
LSKTAQRELRSMSDHDDRLWRLAYAKGRQDARRRPKRLSWQAVCLLLMAACGVGDVVWPYRWIAAVVAAVLLAVVVSFWRRRKRARRRVGRRWVSDDRF